MCEILNVPGAGERTPPSLRATSPNLGEESGCGFTMRPNLGEESGCGFTTRVHLWGGMVMCTSTTRAHLWIGKVNYTILPFAACHVVTRLSLCCHVLPVRHKLCKIGIANQNNSVNACRFRRKVVPLHRNSTEGMGD